MTFERKYKPIRDYAVIGNLRSAALVSKDGSIDWAPAPFIDSPSIFGALLDNEIGGYWSIAPTLSFKTKQAYIKNTNVLVTTFTTKKGVLRLTDFIPIEKEREYSSEEKEATFKIHRKIECIEGECEVLINFHPAFDYARSKTNLQIVEGGIYVESKKGNAILSSEPSGSNDVFELKDNQAQSKLHLSQGQDHLYIFRYNTAKIVKREDAKDHFHAELNSTIAFWNDWVHKCEGEHCFIETRWNADLMRSSLLLKILFFDPIGTISAAPTTSLPEEIGGVRNWDYRFTWLRDSAFALQALFRLGHIEEARRYVNWFLDQCDHDGIMDPERLQIMYGIRGQEEIREEILPHLSGYQNSKPVRIGNDAYRQEQWDIYGSILDLVWQFHMLEHTGIDRRHWDALRAIANHVVKIWKKPDEGLWEVRAGKKHFVYSKVMCWVALDRAVKLMDAHKFEGERGAWVSEMENIKKEVYEKGWSENKQSFVQSYDSDDLDASLLRLSMVGFLDGKDPKMLSTIESIRKGLAINGVLLKRYQSADGLPGREGAFLLASFWLVDAWVFAGKRDEARSIFKRLVELGNHVGLYSEEIDPQTKEFLGNFPQAYTHIGLINSAFLLGAEKANADK